MFLKCTLTNLYSPLIYTNMAATYTLIGFKDYIIIDKIIYRKAYVAKSKSCKFQYRAMRIIKRSFKDNVEGYYLIKNNKRKFYSLKCLKHRLKKQ